jgi:hypothetical protein
MTDFIKRPPPPPAPVFANVRISPKDRAAIKGALRRAFARSDLRESVMLAARIDHVDPAKPRCKKWIRCGECRKPAPEWSSAVDHKIPVIAFDSSFEQMGADLTISAMWCDPANLQAICGACHDAKTAAEKLVKEDYQISMGYRAPRKIKKPKRVKKAKD